MDAISTPRRVQRVRYDLKRRDLVVTRTRPLGASFVEVTLAGDSLADFQSGSFDDHVKVLFPAPGGDGTVGRDYTPRRFDAARRELVIEFLLHGDGVAAAWARGAVPGSRLVVGGPRGSMIVPTDYAWHLLAGDESALPAIARRLEELPAGAQAWVLAQASDRADRRDFASDAHVNAVWVDTPRAFLVQAAQLRLPTGEGYVWAAGEASAMAALRDDVLVNKRHPREAARIAAYWKRGASAHHENLG